MQPGSLLTSKKDGSAFEQHKQQHHPRNHHKKPESSQEQLKEMISIVVSSRIVTSGERLQLVVTTANHGAFPSNHGEIKDIEEWRRSMHAAIERAGGL